VDPILFDTLGHPAIFIEFLKWYGDRQNSGFTTSVANTTHIGISLASITHSNFFSPWVLDSSATDHITGNKKLFSLLYLPLVIYLLLSWLMAIGSHLMILVLFISFLRYLLIMLFMSLGFPLTYYVLVVQVYPSYPICLVSHVI